MSANLYALFASRFAAARDSVCLELDDGTRYTYADLDAESARYANLLVSLGLKRGDRVAAQVEKSPQSVFLYLGCLRAGFVYLPLNTAYQQGEIGYFVGDAQPGAAFCRPEARPWFEGVPLRLEVPAAPRHSTLLGTRDRAAACLPCPIHAPGTTSRA